MSQNVKEITKNRPKCTNFVEEMTQKSQEIHTFFLPIFPKPPALTPSPSFLAQKPNPCKIKRPKKSQNSRFFHSKGLAERIIGIAILYSSIRTDYLANAA